MLGAGQVPSGRRRQLAWHGIRWRSIQLCVAGAPAGVSKALASTPLGVESEAGGGPKSYMLQTYGLQL